MRRLSALADKTAVLSELNVTVRGSVLCPGINSCDETAASGLRSPTFNVQVSMLLFFNSATIYAKNKLSYDYNNNNNYYYICLTAFFPGQAG